jgi:site-specific DNA-methyltransferase (adenine-specific)
MKQDIVITSSGSHSFRLYQTDAASFLDSLSPNIADLVFIDPPFNLKKTYNISGFIDRSDPDVYFGWLTSILKKSIRLLKPGAALYVYHMPSIAFKIAALLDNHLTFRHWIAVSMKNNFARGRRLYPAHYALLYFTLGEPSYFQRPKTELKTCRHCGQFIKDYGGYLQIVQAKGLNLSDFWDDLSPLRHSTTKKRSQNELPPELFSRVFAISGHPGGTYVDPFIGSGGGLLAAMAAHMQAIGADASADSCELAKLRLKERIIEGA